MAKHKSPRCSTGHGTGVTPPVGLRRLLDSRRMRFLGVGMGSVERPARRQRALTPEERAFRVQTGRRGYFRRLREAFDATVTENRRNLGAWA